VKNYVSNQKTLLILSFLSILSAALCAVFNDAVLFLPIALLASVFYFDKTDRRIFSIFCSSLMVIINFGGILLGVTYYLFAPVTIILGFAIRFAFVNKQSKSDTAFLMIAICGLFTFVSYLFLAMIYQNDYSFDAAISFYNELINLFRGYFVNVMFEAFKTAGFEVTTDALAEIFNLQVNLIVSFLLIHAFLIVGLSFKLFGFILKKWSEEKDEIKSWRFKTSNVYAYTYIILVFATIFLNASNFSIKTLPFISIPCLLAEDKPP
jgi:hypothetical protein